MEQRSPSSRRTLLIGLGAAVGLVLVITLIAFAIIGLLKRDDATPVAEANKDRVATKDEINQNLSDLDKSLKQVNADQSAVKAALKDDEKQVKVSE